ncbi:MAG: DUF3800 domain-containing protein [Spirochaetales bacterium]|nr:DUF3800 domain-containing protein [Spirochaetales bacterium]
MYVCYVDESGTPEIPGTTSHYVLAGISIPVWHWKTCERDISALKRKYTLQNAEIHAGWILRKYREQSQIQNFESLQYSDRIYQVEKIRNSELLRLQKNAKGSAFKQLKKGYRLTKDFIHLSLTERQQFIVELAQKIESWGFARIFGECIDKLHFNPQIAAATVDEQAFEQLVSRFQHYLSAMNSTEQHPNKSYGLLVHDNNETVAKKHTVMMRRFHVKGTLWTDIDSIIETPLFVNSELTGLIQIADLCSYAIRRYLENKEEELFLRIFARADRRDGRVVGLRHFTDNTCQCHICKSHR